MEKSWKNIPALIGVGWEDLSPKMDSGSGVHILALGNLRKIFFEDEEISTTDVNYRFVPQNPDVLKVISPRCQKSYSGFALDAGEDI